jgi:hypothetical protein
VGAVKTYGKSVFSGSGSGSGDGSGDGYGSGYGSGDGYGDGYGYGDGDGSGYGYGYGDGYGYGYGSGSGYGSGYGYGYGDGYGDGYGSGDGYGDGYGDGSGSGYLKNATVGFIAMLPEERKAHAEELMRTGAKIAYWRSGKDARPSNGGSADPVDIGTVQKIEGPLKICTAKALHATYRLDKWSGDRIWLVALKGQVVEQEDKLGALEREILAELTGGVLR